MTKWKARYVAFMSLGLVWAADARSECFGEASYRVCTETETSANGDLQTRSWDTEGNSYPVDVQTRQIGNAQVSTSSDSEGNEYSIRSWSDSSGSHVADSEGTTCTVTPAGRMIGCD